MLLRGFVIPKLVVQVKLLLCRLLSSRFEIVAVVGGRRFPPVQSNNKKDGRTEAADLALRLLMAEGEFSMASGASKISLQVRCSLSHSDE